MWNWGAASSGSSWIWRAVDEIYGILFWHYYQPRVYFGVGCKPPTMRDSPKMCRHGLINSDIGSKAKQGVGKNLSYVETYKSKLVAAGVRRPGSCACTVRKQCH
jgi:hypothetical protein